MVIPAATAARMPETPICSASDKKRMAARTVEQSASQVHHAPAAEESQRATIQPAHYKTARIPPMATFINSTVAPPTVKSSSPSPLLQQTSTTPGRRRHHQRFALQNAHDFFRDAPFATIPESATASVGESTAASAKAGSAECPAPPSK